MNKKESYFDKVNKSIFNMNMYISPNLDFHKSRVKKMFKEIKKYGFSQASFIETNFIADYVVKYLPYRKDNFTFTLMNAQHTYSKCLGFDSWKQLKEFCFLLSHDFVPLDHKKIPPLEVIR